MTTADCSDPARVERENRTISRALRVLERRMRYRTATCNNPDDARNFLRLQLDGLEREEFWAVWLDSQHRVIAAECLFAGTLNQTSVYPREVVKQAIAHNAAAVIFAHNHPSGAMSPSAADVSLTATLKQALLLIDVQSLDHFIIGSEPRPYSFAEAGLI